jgi:hypothetical protein
MICTHRIRPDCRISRFLVALPLYGDLLLCAKHLFVAAITARHGLQVVTRRARLARLQPRGLARNLRPRHRPKKRTSGSLAVAGAHFWLVGVSGT